MYRLIGLAVLFCLQTLGSAFAQQPLDPAKIKDAYQNAVVFLAVFPEPAGGGPIPPGSKPECEFGTGFLISSSGYLITSKHLLQDDLGRPYKNFRIAGRLGEPFDCNFPLGDIFEISPVEQLGQQDAMLLRIKSTRTFDYIQACRENIVDDGKELVFLGYPLGQPLAARKALLGNKNGPMGMWQFDAALMAGNSGGPVFNEGGKLVGLVFGDVKTGNDLSFLVPLQHFSTLYSLAQSPLIDCQIADIGLCAPIEIAHSVQLQKESLQGPKPTFVPVEAAFPAEAGRKIVAAEWRASSTNNVSVPIIDISEDGDKVEFSAMMESGPMYNAYRAWAFGLIITKQVSKECTQISSPSGVVRSIGY